MNIFITGSNGFVGKNVIHYFKHKNTIFTYERNQMINIKQDVVLHFAGKAHDLNTIRNHEEYYKANTDLTKNLFNSFLVSNAKIFIFISTVKAVVDKADHEITEDDNPNPKNHYGKSKLLAEEYILSKKLQDGKRFFILRPCMIHGPGNKGNLNLLYSIISKGLPWPLGAFENKRSFCSIDNLCFIINELINNDKIASGVYNIADNDAMSTNELISLIAQSQNKKFKIWNVPKSIILMFSKLGDLFSLPLTTERLNKLTETYIVSNNKIKNAINKPLPVSTKEGLLKTFDSFNKMMTR